MYKRTTADIEGKVVHVKLVQAPSNSFLIFAYLLLFFFFYVKSKIDMFQDLLRVEAC